LKSVFLEQINQKSIINGSVYISAKLFDTHLRTYFDTYHIRFSSYEKKNILLTNSKNRPFNDIEAKATYQNSPRNRINKKTGSMIKNQ